MPQFFTLGKDGAVELVAGRLNDAKLQPLSHMFLCFLSVGIGNLELLDINRFFSFEGNVM